MYNVVDVNDKNDACIAWLTTHAGQQTSLQTVWLFNPNNGAALRREEQTICAAK